MQMLLKSLIVFTEIDRNSKRNKDFLKFLIFCKLDDNFTINKDTTK